LDDLQNRLPYFTTRFLSKKVHKIEVVAQINDDKTYKVLLLPFMKPSEPLSLSLDPTFEGMHRVSKDLDSEVELGTWRLKLQRDRAEDFKSLPADMIEELFLIINYRVA
jgi:hypothetical protein